MKASKVWKKLLAGVLCASVIVQAVPANVSASEAITVVETEMEDDRTSQESTMQERTSQESITEQECISEETALSEVQEDLDSEVECSTAQEIWSQTETPLQQEIESETLFITETQEEAESEAQQSEESISEELVQEGASESTESSSSSGSSSQEPDDIIDYTTLRMGTEEKYYYYGDNADTLFITAKLSNCEIPEEVSVHFSIDDKVCGENAPEPFGKIYKDEKQEGYYIIVLKKDELQKTSSNNHNLLLTLTRTTADGGTRELVRRVAVFQIQENPIFLEKMPYYMGASDDSVEVTIFNTADDISRIALSNNGETVAAPDQDSVPIKARVKTDPRYTGICAEYEFPDEVLNEALSQTDVLLYKSTWTLKNLKNAIDLGSYNLNLVFNTGETMDISGAVSITSEAVVTNCTVATDYDNTSPYAYLFIQGSGFNPDNITFNFRFGSATGTPLSSTKAGYKEVWSGYIFKFQKIGNSWPKAGEDIYVSLRGNNIWFSKNEFTSTVQTGIYYAAYNPVLKAIEAGVAVDLNGKRTQFSIVENENSQTGNPVTVNSLTESLVYLTPQNALTAGTQYVKLVVDGKSYFKKFDVDAEVLDTNRWDAPKVISQNAERHYFYYYYEEAGITSSDLSAKLTSENGTSREIVVSATEWLREDAGRGTSIKVVIPTQKLELGKYKVEIFKNEEAGKTEIASYEFELVAGKSNKFILDEYSISWINDDAMQVYIKTPNCSEEDDFDIKLTETSGRVVEDLKAVITNRYSDSIFLEVTGLKRTKAFRDYYVLLTHKNKEYENMGYPYTMDDMTKPYYAENENEKGELKTIAFNRGMPIKVTANNRVVGINLQYMALPATVNLYAPNDTTSSVDLTITSATEDDYYYFTKEFYDRLPNKDTLYDMVISDGDGWGRTYPGVTIGYREETVQNDFRAEITTNMLFLGEEGEDTAVITVTGNKQKPFFEAADESIVTVAVDEENPNSAVVSAAEKTGTTVVTIFADGVEKTIIVTVTVKVDGIVLNTSNRRMVVGDTFDVEAYMLPSGSQDDTHHITFTSSDPNVLYVKPLTATTARITAMGSGTAILRASLNGTTHVTNMSVSVTGLFSLTEKKMKIAEAGISSYIENVDRTLEYCELPEGWTWNDDSVSLSASDDAPVQYFGATYTQEGYESFSTRLPVSVTRITGMKIDGRTLINRGREETFRVTYEYVGRNVTWEEIDKRLSVNCVRVTEDEIASVVSADKDEVVIETKNDTEGGTAEFRYTLSIDNGTIEGSDMLAQTFSITVPVEDCVDNIVLTPVKRSGQGFTFMPENKRMDLDLDEVERANGKYAVSIAIEATINEVPARNITFEWKSNDEEIASFTKDKKTGELVTDKDGNVVLNIKRVGVVQVTATANDQGAFTGTLTINVMDYEPVLETTVITVNKNNTAGTQFGLQEQNGNSIRKIRVLETVTEEQKAESANFAVKLPVNGLSVMTLKENAPAKSYDKKTTTNASLEVVTTKGRYEYPVTIVTEITTPTATLKLKKKANLFYTNAEAVYTISSKYEIASIKDVGSEAYVERFYGVYNKNSKTVTFNTKGGLNNETVGLFTASKSPRLETTLEVYFVGYNEPQRINVKVKTENKKPSLSITGLTVCPGMTSGRANVIDSKTKKTIALDSATTQLTLQKPIDGLATPIVNTSRSMDISYYGTKNASYTVLVRDRNWTQSVAAKGKISYVKSPEQLSLVLGKKQVILNMGTIAKDNVVSNVSVPVSISGNDVQITSMRIDGTAQTLIDSGALSYRFDPKKQMINLGLGKNSQMKKGSYRLNLYASIMVGDSPIEVKKATLTIKIMDEKSAKVTLTSGKGKINLIERSTTSVVYTPKVSGIDSPIKSVAVTGDNAKLFTASLNGDNKVEVKAKTRAVMSSKTTYKVAILATLENGYQVETIAKVKPVNKLPNVVLSPKEGSLYRTNSNKYVTSLSLEGSNLGLNSISDVTLNMKGQDAQNFSLSYDLVRNGTLSFALAGDKLNMKKGTYKLACQVYFKDADADAKPATVNVTITVK